MVDDGVNEKKAEIEKLVLRVKEGDQEAFAELYNTFVDRIYRYVYYRVKVEDAEDLVGTVFLKAWENIWKYKAKKGSFSSWIFRIAHNLVIDYYRASKDVDFEELKIDIPSYKREHNPIGVVEQGFDVEVLKCALKKIKKTYQEVIIYKFINELSNAEIALILKKSEGSLRILQHRALKALKVELEEMNIKYWGNL
jgi:RNA polymerase sigma-70 factor (ECF subfamily)